jgi:hypothetical protein
MQQDSRSAPRARGRRHIYGGNGHPVTFQDPDLIAQTFMRRAWQCPIQTTSRACHDTADPKRKHGGKRADPLRFYRQERLPREIAERAKGGIARQGNPSSST